MKRLIIFIGIGLLARNANCETNRQQNTRLYTNDEKFVGRVVGPKDNQRLLDNNEQFMGRIIQDKEGKSIRVYNMENGQLKYKGRIIK